MVDIFMVNSIVVINIMVIIEIKVILLKVLGIEEIKLNLFIKRKVFIEIFCDLELFFRKLVRNGCVLKLFFNFKKMFIEK